MTSGQLCSKWWMHCICDSPSSHSSAEKQMQSLNYTHRQARSPCLFHSCRDVDGAGGLLWFSILEWKTSLLNRWQPEISFVCLDLLLQNFLDQILSTRVRCARWERRDFWRLASGDCYFVPDRCRCWSQPASFNLFVRWWCRLFVLLHFRAICASGICQLGEVKISFIERMCFFVCEFASMFIVTCLCIALQFGFALVSVIVTNRPHESAPILSNFILFEEINKAV